MKGEIYMPTVTFQGFPIEGVILITRCPLCFQVTVNLTHQAIKRRRGNRQISVVVIIITAITVNTTKTTTITVMVIITTNIIIVTQRELKVVSFIWKLKPIKYLTLGCVCNNQLHSQKSVVNGIRYNRNFYYN